MNETRNLRGYFFGNFYLSQIQQGIQAAHVIQNMIAEYSIALTRATNALYDWCGNHKTMILLNGGMQSDLLELYDRLEYLSNGFYPTGIFKEEDAALNGAVTSVGIILPRSIYDEDRIMFNSNPDHHELHNIIKSYKLA